MGHIFGRKLSDQILYHSDYETNLNSLFRLLIYNSYAYAAVKEMTAVYVVIKC